VTKVVVNGTFDILHRGHIEMLNYAKSLGDYLLVLIDTDQRVKELKGQSRPINNQDDRQFALKNLKAVDDVWVFNSREELIKKIKKYDPDIMVKGSDYKDKSIIGKELVPTVVYYDRTEHSTTKTIQDIINRG
jgi:D-beta-D-heptose 7-phosphate kinase/D-beta-D-heptose 1-phosphate adenosyltransferase